MHELENTTILVVQLDPESHALVITVDRKDGAIHLANKFNASQRRVLQISPTDIRLLSLARDQVMMLELEIPTIKSTPLGHRFPNPINPILVTNNPTSIPLVQFVLADRRAIATIRLDTVEIYLNQLPSTANYLKTLSPTYFKATLKPFGSDRGWQWSLN
jgi:hypothetical protein